MSKTVEVPIDWLIKLLEKTRDTVKFHNGVPQQLDPTDAALLLGHVSSIEYLLPDVTKEQQGGL